MTPTGADLNAYIQGIWKNVPQTSTICLARCARESNAKTLCSSKGYEKPQLMLEIKQMMKLILFKELYKIHHHHHVVPLARISLTLSRYFSLSFIPSGRSSGLHPISSHSCWMYVRAGHPEGLVNMIYQKNVIIWQTAIC